MPNMQPKWSNRNILVTEDDPLNFKYLEILIKKRTGANIIWAKTGQEAYEKIINSSDLDLVLLDNQLPVYSGLEVLDMIRPTVPDLPVIMQTANTWNNENENCLKAGANAFFNKPLDIDALFIKMDELMSEYESIKEKCQNELNYSS